MKTSTLMESPTGLGIRYDSEGQGQYRAPRIKWNKQGNRINKGRRLHAGTDYICKPGQIIVSPISGKIKRIAYPYKDKQYGGVVIEGDFFTIKMFYFEPSKELIGKKVSKGDQIGTAQDISKRYSKKMTPHIHLQVDRADPNLFIGV